MEEYVLAAEAAMITGVSERQLRDYVRAGKLTRHQAEGRRTCYPRRELEEIAAVRSSSIPFPEVPGQGEDREVPGALMLHPERLIHRLEEENAFLRARLERLETLLEACMANLAAAHEERRALGAPRPSWWRRMFNFHA